MIENNDDNDNLEAPNSPNLITSFFRSLSPNHDEQANSDENDHEHEQVEDNQDENVQSSSKSGEVRD